ncbi:MAG TPA: hypothetical protein PLX30_05340 [Methanothrix sp.]|nr:hypothetical protein [Methanothrix sp.]
MRKVFPFRFASLAIPIMPAQNKDPNAIANKKTRVQRGITSSDSNPPMSKRIAVGMSIAAMRRRYSRKGMLILRLCR